MISVAEAVQIVTAQTPSLEPERTLLAGALGRFLAEDGGYLSFNDRLLFHPVSISLLRH